MHHVETDNKTVLILKPGEIVLWCGGNELRGRKVQNRMMPFGVGGTEPL
jgi:hypothetical protein